MFGRRRSFPSPTAPSPLPGGGGAFRFPRHERDKMLNLLGLCGVGYLAAAGVATNAAVVGRGLVRAARSAAAGNLGDAAVEALSAVAAPVAMSYAATAALLMDVIDGAGDLIRPVLHEADPEGVGRHAA